MDWVGLGISWCFIRGIEQHQYPMLIKDDDEDGDGGVSINASGQIWRVSCHLH